MNGTSIGPTPFESHEQCVNHQIASIVYLVLATVAANLLGSPPVWLLIVAPPSSGKTEILDALLDLPNTFAISTLTEAGLLTGSSSRNGENSGGLLRQIGDWGFLVISHFTTLLSEHGSTKSRIFALFRELFDGMLRRVLGSDGGRVLEWKGHLGVIAATTEAIDSPVNDQGPLGERWCYYRPPEMTPVDELLACLETDRHAGHLDEIRAERRRAVAAFFADLSLPNEFPPISEADSERLSTLAGIGSRCRSSVVRNGHSREVELVPAHERSMRLYRQLRHLHAGFSVIGAPDAEAWRLLVKVALDGIHPGRRAVLDLLTATEAPHATAAIAGHCRLPVTPVRRHLEDLVAHCAVDFVGQNPECWSASIWLREQWWAVTGSAGAARPGAMSGRLSTGHRQSTTSIRPGVTLAYKTEGSMTTTPTIDLSKAAIRERAVQFAKRCEGAKSEAAEKQTSWNELFGVTRRPLLSSNK